MFITPMKLVSFILNLIRYTDNDISVDEVKDNEEKDSINYDELVESLLNLHERNILFFNQLEKLINNYEKVVEDFYLFLNECFEKGMFVKKLIFLKMI
ncbi:hypothetical protein A0H76_2024 [Hepatospora eriocheir]|uniref:Uncharacterized protein n=1 Tax=Hepatospora eriocheir TaxID=1081669 RepID=A0A1X0QG55_9MICR|nr:hypothetical protein A0H76_2024 [Hepatospora eriocheir]